MAKTTSAKIVKNIPTSECGVDVKCKTISGQEYLISQCPEKQRFTLWKKCDEGFEKISTSKSPLDFDEIIPWDK